MDQNTTNNVIEFKIDRKIYPIEVIFGACFNFIDRCYVYIDRDGKDTISVRLKGKEMLGETELETVSGEFHNELLNQALRKKINQSNKKIREYIVSRALFSAEPIEEQEAGFEDAPGEDLDFEEDFLDDPLQIAVPWDEKYGDKTKKETAGEQPAETESGAPGAEA